MIVASWSPTVPFDSAEAASEKVRRRSRLPTATSWNDGAILAPNMLKDAMDEWIVTDPATLGGKPCIRGTRISVEFVLELLASGAGPDAILRGYPQVSPEGLSAAFQYAARSLRNEVIWEIEIPA